MPCPRFREAISARLDGEALGMPAADLDVHLDRCAACSDWSAQAGLVTAAQRDDPHGWGGPWDLPERGRVRLAHRDEPVPAVHRRSEYDIGAVPKRVLIRGVGPTLADFGVAGTLADPQLALVNNLSAVIATNDNWGTPIGTAAADAAQIYAAATAVGAFALTPGSKDATLLLNLAPGAYTVQVSGPATGTALVEVYEVP